MVTKNKIILNREGTFSGMDLDKITMRMELYERKIKNQDNFWSCLLHGGELLVGMSCPECQRLKREEE